MFIMTPNLSNCVFTVQLMFQVETLCEYKMSCAGIQSSNGVSYEELAGQVYEKFNKDMVSFKNGFVRLQPYNQVLPRCFLNYEKRIKDFEVRPDDVWVASFPKCGTIFSLFLLQHNAVYVRHSLFYRNYLDPGNGLVHNEQLQLC